MKHPISSYEKLNINIPKQTNLEKKTFICTTFICNVYIQYKKHKNSKLIAKC